MKGFTLVETLIVIGITMILSGLFVGYNKTADEQIALFKDQALFVGTINRAKALAQQKLNITNACAFGVHIENAQDFFIFADITQNPPCVKEISGVETYTADHIYNSARDVTLERFSLDKRLSFVSGVGKDIIFTPPDLKLYDQATVKIQSVAGSRSATVEVTSGGQIITQ